VLTTLQPGRRVPVAVKKQNGAEDDLGVRLGTYPGS